MKERKSLNVINWSKLKHIIKNDVKKTRSGCAEWNKLPEDGDRW
jgi:hypothetical protein